MEIKTSSIQMQGSHSSYREITKNRTEETFVGIWNMKLSNPAKNTDSVTQTVESNLGKNRTLQFQILNYLLQKLFYQRISGNYESTLEGNFQEYVKNNAWISQTSIETTTTVKAEETGFQMEGTVCTTDGREIPLSLEVSMSSRFMEENVCFTESMKKNMCDPLVLNLDTDAAGFSTQKIYFDLDGDGKKEKIAALDEKSGYLAWDKNQDGIINDGTELFGPATQDGFSELAKLDMDHNGWIDEQDPIFNQLSIWCQNVDGSSSLYRLKDKGIGAICLYHVKTEFALEDGQIQSSGIYLTEQGTAKTMQHVDLKM